jgi:hypothetical protein
LSEKEGKGEWVFRPGGGFVAPGKKEIKKQMINKVSQKMTNWE